MIAVVSSTVAPSASPSHDGARTTFSSEERLEHTQGTVASLLAGGVRNILIADNSAGGWPERWSRALAPAQVLHFTHPPYRNKGIGEMRLLLSALEHLPDGTPVMKISGRYRLGPRSPLFSPPTAEVTARVYRHRRRREISTRAYLLRDRSVAERMWRQTLDEMHRQPHRIVGPRSLFRFLRGFLARSGSRDDAADPVASVELAAFAAVRHLGLSLASVDQLELEGVLGSWINPEVRE